MFKLYHKERTIFSFEDYAALMKLVEEIGAKRVLEFGPGISTLALIEAGVEVIDSYEYDSTFLASAQERFQAYPQVTVRRFYNASLCVVLDPPPDARRYALAFVDSPIGEGPRRRLLPGQEELSRYNTVMYALSKAPVVALHDAKRDGEQNTLARLAAEGFTHEMIDTRKGIAVLYRA